jgi:chemotaxis-related protein WspD
MNQSKTTLNSSINIDACWKSKGIYGDRSCEKLKEHIHCRNCEVYTEAASILRDQFYLNELVQEDVVLNQHLQSTDIEPMQRYILFRLDSQWFAILSRFLSEVSLNLAIRAVPNRHSTTLRGVCNVKGQLLPCISMHRMFSLSESAVNEVTSRMLVLQHSSGAFVVSVDQILEITLLTQSIWDFHKMHSGSVLGQLSAAAAVYKKLDLTLLNADALLTQMLKELQ